VDVSTGATSVANGVGVGLLPIGVSGGRLLSKARSRGLRRVVMGLVLGVVVQTSVSLIAVSVVPGIGDRGTVVRIGIAIVAIRFTLLGRVLIPRVLAQDIYSLVNRVGVVCLAKRVLLLKSFQKWAVLGLGGRPKEEVGIKF